MVHSLLIDLEAMNRGLTMEMIPFIGDDIDIMALLADELR